MTAEPTPRALPRPIAALRRRPVQSAAAGLLVLGVAAGLIAADPAGADRQVPGGALRVDTTTCGRAPARLPAGPVSFSVTNASKVYATVYVVSADASLAYAEIPWLGPGKTLPLATTLTGGQYAVRCVFSSGPVQTTGAIAVDGTAAGAVRGYQPMNDKELTAPVTAYRAYVTAALPKLLAAAQTLDADLARGDLDAARADWLPAHLAYERLGAAYNSFGDYDTALNGMAGGLPQGVDTPTWTGFFALEHGLWHGATAAKLRPLSQQLVSDASGLIDDFPSEDTDPGTLPLRAHEILENALQEQLTGTADYGSGTTLATLDANVQGTEEVLSVLAPVVQPRDPALLTRLNAELPALEAQVAAAKKPDGSWIPVAELPADQRRRLDGSIGDLLEQLAALPNLLTPRNHA
ncbi:EfeM/EfeO family lipoprotein [Kitasatospora viridis]|uniref:Iron uptake system EfeUOB component EfeO/EfeM n=1 Tax=Kitasatospora viridis TaxID=281105 RepID=A0A561T6I1_9ACTN|nr:EfeM/EfeO family lipoprotein [Kitasatospora viridis]TWF82726.1 iron uptake system EfeUOB component EfeO/EfeM [Kitasatospora viridis]